MLLREHGYEFDIDLPQIEEATPQSHPFFTPIELARYNAWIKANDVSRRHPNEIVIAADTIVFFDSEIFGKPVDLEDARRILRFLRGKTHSVVTAVACMHASSKLQDFFHEISRVLFYDFSEKDLEDYLASVHVLDKSGAYASQENSAKIIKRIDGLVSNVVGLPIERLLPVLDRISKLIH